MLSQNIIPEGPKLPPLFLTCGLLRVSFRTIYIVGHIMYILFGDYTFYVRHIGNFFVSCVLEKPVFYIH